MASRIVQLVSTKGLTVAAGAIEELIALHADGSISRIVPDGLDGLGYARAVKAQLLAEGTKVS